MNPLGGGMGSALARCNNCRMRAFTLTTYEPEVQSELFRLGHSNMLANVFSAVVLRTLMSVAVWNAVPAQSLGIWLGASVPSILAAVVLWWAFRAQANPSHVPSAKTLTAWMWGHAAVMGLLGLSSGMIGVLLGANTVLNLLIACAFVGSAAYSVAGNSTHDLLAFALTVLLGGSAMSVFVPNGYGEYALYMIGATWLYMSVLCVAAYHSHKTVVNSIRLRLANQSLAQQHARAAAQAEQANRDKSEFLAATSHDLRQPVHALLLFVEALRQQRQSATVQSVLTEPRTPDAQDALIGQIAAAGQAISTLFNDLMELSRLESGAEKAMPSAFEMTPFLRQCIAGVNAQAQGKGLSLRLVVAKPARAVMVNTDRVMLARVVVNLLTNAIRYTERGGVLVSLRLRTQTDATTPNWPATALELAVWDTGIGIDPTQNERIFEPYVQLSNEERDRQKGLGLGLAIVRQCLKLMQLDIAVTSQPERGSRFAIRLPDWRHLPAEASADQVNVEPDARQTQGLAGRRLLLVDDDAMVRNAQKALLDGWQMDLRITANAEEALRLTKDWPGWNPDYILCDFRLPGSKDGVVLLNELLEIYPQAIGILQTGERAERVQAEAEDAGYVVLFKPVLPAQLAATLTAVLPVSSPATLP